MVGCGLGLLGLVGLGVVVGHKAGVLLAVVLVHVHEGTVVVVVVVG